MLKRCGIAIAIGTVYYFIALKAVELIAESCAQNSIHPPVVVVPIDTCMKPIVIDE